jgi:hypothetical protein
LFTDFWEVYTHNSSLSWKFLQTKKTEHLFGIL